MSSSPPVPTDGSGHRLPHMPALDGLRAVALVPVLCFHAGFSWVSGGYLPLTAFFVLSGFLITGLLLVERDRTGGVSLRRFWTRRVRRLFPAAALGIVLAGVFVAAAGSADQVDNFRGDAAAALGNVANWRFVFSGQVYADLFAQPSPLQHYWSLAVEEQFYLVFPLIVAGALAVGRGRRWVLAGVLISGVVASTLVMRALFHPGDPPLRVYFGSDTRAAELLVGALLALVLVRRRGLWRAGGAAARALDGAGLVALVVTVTLWLRVTEFEPALYEGGLLGVAVLAAVVVAAAAAVPGGLTAGVLALRPVAALGRVSYGVYIFHWPVFLWLTEDRTGLGGWELFAVRMAVTLGLAVASYRLVEQPVRTGRPLPRPAGALAWVNSSVVVAGLAAVLAVPTAAAPAITFRAGGDALPSGPPPTLPTSTTTTAVETTAPPEATTDGGAAAAPAPTTRSTAASAVDGGGARPSPPATAAPSPGPETTTTTAPPGPPPPLRVAVVGDSLAQNLAGGLGRWAERHGGIVVWDLSIQSCPVSRGGVRLLANGDEWPVHPACGWWETEGAARMAEFRPDVVLVQTGHGEVFDRRLPQWGDIARAPGDPVFDRWMLGEYQAAAEVFASTAARVVWSLPPCVLADRRPGFIDDDEGNARLRHLIDETAADLVRTRAVVTADLHAQLCPRGEFTDDALGVENGRPDGWHLSDRLADAVAERWLVDVLLAAAGR